MVGVGGFRELDGIKIDAVNAVGLAVVNGSSQISQAFSKGGLPSVIFQVAQNFVEQAAQARQGNAGALNVDGNTGHYVGAGLEFTRKFPLRFHARTTLNPSVKYEPFISYSDINIVLRYINYPKAERQGQGHVSFPLRLSECIPGGLPARRCSGHTRKAVFLE